MNKYINDTSNSNIINNDKYQLKNVIIHSGSSILGYYFSLVRDNKSEIWYECNDSKINNIDKNNFIKYTFEDEDDYSSEYVIL